MPEQNAIFFSNCIVVHYLVLNLATLHSYIAGDELAEKILGIEPSDVDCPESRKDEVPRKIIVRAFKKSFNLSRFIIYLNKSFINVVIIINHTISKSAAG